RRSRARAPPAAPPYPLRCAPARRGAAPRRAPRARAPPAPPFSPPQPPPRLRASEPARRQCGAAAPPPPQPRRRRAPAPFHPAALFPGPLLGPAPALRPFRRGRFRRLALARKTHALGVGAPALRRRPLCRRLGGFALAGRFHRRGLRRRQRFRPLGEPLFPLG